MTGQQQGLSTEEREALADVRAGVWNVCDQIIADHPMWIGDDGRPLDYLPEREARIADFVREVAEACRDALAPAIAARLADLTAERDALAEVVAAQAEYVELVARIHEVYRHLVMDTDEDRALHARHVETADKALALARAALGSTDAAGSEGGA